MKSKTTDQPPKIAIGYRVGKLTVAEPTEARKNGYTIWRCKCDCGNDILLDTRALQRGTITDCGCITKVTPGQKDLTGQRFGRLVCLAPTDQRHNNGAIIWQCKCDCGKECLAASTQLSRGYKKSCGCMSHPPLKHYVGQRFGRLLVTGYYGKIDGAHHWECKCDCGNTTFVHQTRLQSGKTKSCGCLGHPPVKDILGAQFGDLTVIEDVGNRDGHYYCRCKCACGNETVVRRNYLLTGRTKSCGCLQARIIKDTMKFVDGTSITLLEKASTRLISTNTSGYNGVYRSRQSGKWVAQITLKKKTYYLGSFDKIEDAVKARKKAEARMYGEFLDQHADLLSETASEKPEDSEV